MCWKERGREGRLRCVCVCAGRGGGGGGGGFVLFGGWYSCLSLFVLWKVSPPLLQGTAGILPCVCVDLATLFSPRQKRNERIMSISSVLLVISMSRILFRLDDAIVSPSCIEPRGCTVSVRFPSRERHTESTLYLCIRHSLSC